MGQARIGQRTPLGKRIGNQEKRIIDLPDMGQRFQRQAEAKRRVTLLYASRNEEYNNATVLKELLEGMPKPPSSVGSAATGRARIRKAKRQ